MKLCNFCIKRPVFTTVLSLLLIVIGFICYQKLPLRYLPKMTVPVVTISTDYPGASSRTVETQVTDILEDSLSGLAGLKYMTSASHNGNSQIILTFQLDTNLNNAAADIRANVAKVLEQLPPDAKPPVVSKTNPNAQPILFLAYFNPNESVGALTNYVKQFIVPQFEASRGIAKVTLWSSHYDALRIWLNPSKMAARGMTVNDVTNVLKNQNTTVPTGTIKGEQLAYTVVTDLTLHRPAEFANLVMKDEDNHVIRLKDIAKVTVGSEHRTSSTVMHYFSVDGRPGVAIGLIPEAGANALDMTNEALRLSRQISASLPDDMRQIVEYNQSNFTQAALQSVYEAIIEAIVLVMLVIALFLGSFRSAWVPIVTVPICLMSTFAMIYFLGYSINSITLLALVLAVGLVVDDAIIMLENTSRFIEQGDEPLTAAFKGSKQIARPVIAMTITLAGIYLPVAFASGISGIFFKEFAFTLLSAIFISGFVALTLSPMMCAKTLRPHHAESRYTIWLTHRFQQLQSRYHGALAFCLARTRWLLTGLVVLVIISSTVFYALPQKLAPSINMPLINLWVKTAPQDSFAKTQSFIPQFEKVLDQNPAIEDYLMQNWSVGSFYAVLALKADKIKHSDEVAKQLQNQLSNIPGTKVMVHVAPPPLTWSLPSANPGQIELNVLTTASYKQLASMLQNLMEKVKANKDFINPDTTLQWNTRQLNINVNRDLAADLNVPVSAITNTLETMLGGKQVGKYDFGNQNFDVIMQLSDDSLKSTAILDRLYVHSGKQKMIPLQSLITTSEKNVPLSLDHYNRLRSGTLTASLVPGVPMGEAINTLKALSKEMLPSSATISFSGSAQQYLESSGTMAWIFVVALVFIYLILAAQFESFADPLIILTCVPFALIGALVLLKLTGNSLNLYSEIGLITLIGLIAKHGILITDFANEKLKEGKALSDAVLEAAQLRLRPILMTTAAMILGALPLALAFGPGSENRHQIGWVIVGGLFFGTLISLFIVPLAFVFVKSNHELTSQKRNTL